MSNMKEKIKSVSIELFFKKGYFATSISAIARGSGIQKASIYYHYASKEKLLLSILKQTMDDLTVYLKNNISDIEDVELRMRTAVHGHVYFHLDRQKETFIANSELRSLNLEHYERIVKKRNEYELIFQDIIQEGINKGVFPEGDVKILLYAILSLCITGASWFQPSGRLTADEVAAIYEKFIISGLKQGKL